MSSRVVLVGGRGIRWRMGSPIDSYTVQVFSGSGGVDVLGPGIKCRCTFGALLVSWDKRRLARSQI